MDGWRSSTPEDQGMDSQKLAELIDYIQQEQLDLHSVTIIRNGYVVADAAIYPFEGGGKHNLKSVTKSVISALIGIAIEQGHIDGLDQPVLSFFPDRAVANLDARKEAMTLEDVLKMATGLECRDSFKYRWQGAYLMMQSDDWVQHVLDLPMLEEPGTRFEYCNGATLLLSAIIQETTGMTAAEFAEQHLFTPLGIDDVIWPANPQGVTVGFSELRMRPHDMAKIGYLFLQDGQWDGRQIIPASWVAASTTNHIAALGLGGGDYGYQWWVDQDVVYSARGHAGQYIFVVPDSQLVAVFTGNLSDDVLRVPEVLMDIFVLPAVKSAESLSLNPDGLAALESSIQAAAAPANGPEPVPPLPETARRISGQTYLLDPLNPLGLVSFSLTFGDGAEALMTLEYPPEAILFIVEDMPTPLQLDVALGLDNVYRFSPAEFGLIMGAKGEWLADDVFLAHLNGIGNIGWQRVYVAFEGEQITMEFWDDSTSPTTKIPAFNGRLAE
jgi:CubicO group peptidase (beta-lactamase class C family)